MDPVCGTVGLVAGVASIISVIGKSVITLTNLRQKYKEAEFNIILLTGHLHTVRVALLQVQNWVTECLPSEPQHYQLMIDLEQALDHCRILVQHIDDQISRFEWDDELLRVGSKALFLLEDQNTKELLTLLDHQINALNLCLIVFKCRTPNDQKRFLERDETRDVFDQIRDDATSLIGFRDSSSFVSTRTRTSMDTRFSKVFDFDGLLLRHKIYQNSFRSMLRRAGSPTETRTNQQDKRRTLSDTPVLQLQSMARASAKIDSELKQDARKLSKKVKILAIGDKHGRSAVIKQMRLRYGQPFSELEVEYFRQSITSLAVTALVAILDYVKDLGTGLVSQVSRDHAQVVRNFAESAAPEWPVSIGVASSIKHIWGNWHVRQAFAMMQQHGQTAYYLNAIERICQPDYTPTTMDIILAPEAIETMKETEIVISDTCTLRLLELKETHAMKIMPQFADVHFCLFTIDLTCYDRYLDNAAGTNALRDRLLKLKDICLSPYFKETVLMLVFTNASAFEKQIASSPLRSHFPNYDGGNDVNAATKYILKRCKSVNFLNKPLVWHIFSEEEADIESTAQFFRQTTASRPVLLAYI